MRKKSQKIAGKKGVKVQRKLGTTDVEAKESALAKGRRCSYKRWKVQEKRMHGHKKSKPCEVWSKAQRESKRKRKLLSSAKKKGKYLHTE